VRMGMQDMEDVAVTILYFIVQYLQIPNTIK
jgi:hypothetical protein